MVSSVLCKPSIFDNRPKRKISARGRSYARKNRARQNDAYLPLYIGPIHQPRRNLGSVTVYPVHGGGQWIGNSDCETNRWRVQWRLFNAELLSRGQSNENRACYRRNRLTRSCAIREHKNNIHIPNEFPIVNTDSAVFSPEIWAQFSLLQCHEPQTFVKVFTLN